MRPIGPLARIAAHGARICALAVALAMLPLASAAAAQASGRFNVTVNLQPGGGSGAGTGPTLCRSTNAPGSSGAVVTVVCSTGAMVDIAPGPAGARWSPMHGGAYRFVTQVLWNGDWVEGLDNSYGVGTVTSWRVVNLLDQNYVELTVGW